MRSTVIGPASITPAASAIVTGTSFTTATSLDNAIEEYSQRLLSHAFLVKCRDATVSAYEMRQLLIQHGKYGGYFTRFLCALMAQLPNGGDVLQLAENLSDELGFGDPHRVPHSRIYARMLEAFGIVLEEEAINPETENLIATMLMLCQQPGGISGLGALCLGAEAVVPALYTRILQGFDSLRVTPDKLHFFSIHIDCDDEHADTMMAILQREIAASPANRVRAMAAADIAINARLRFFDALLDVEDRQ